MLSEYVPLPRVCGRLVNRQDCLRKSTLKILRLMSLLFVETLICEVENLMKKLELFLYL